MPFSIFDPTMILVIPGLLLAIWAQIKVKNTFAKWSRVSVSRSITGVEMARNILNSKGLSKIPINPIPGELTDNYNPLKRTLNLSEPVYNSSSVAALGVAAHEAGHAIQHNTGYLALQIRNSIFPIARFGSWLPIPLIFMGFILNHPSLINIGIWIFTGFVAFTVITLPVEFNASRRAVQILAGTHYLTKEELGGVKEVLSAASLTYVAAAVTALLELLRLLIIARGRD